MLGQKGARFCSSNGVSGQNRRAGELRIATRRATTDKKAIARAFGMITRPRCDRDVTNCGFPHQRYKPSNLRRTSTESPDTVTLTVNEARSFPTMQMLSEVENGYGVRGTSELHERVSMTNENKNPKERRPIALRRGWSMA